MRTVRYDESHIQRYLDSALELFGARRLMFGSGHLAGVFAGRVIRSDDRNH